MKGIFFMILIGTIGTKLCDEDSTISGIILGSILVIAAFYGFGCYGWAFILAEFVFYAAWMALLVPIGIVIKHCFFLVVIIDCMLSLFIGVIAYNFILSL